MSDDQRLERYLEGLGEDERLFTSVIVEGESRFGIARLPEGQRKSDLEDALAAAVGSLKGIVPISAQTARRYVDIKVQLWATGRPIGENDLWIAATAVERGMTLVSSDEAFHHVQALTVEDWRGA